jgi:translation elongation factor EF-1alpha
VIGTTQVIVAVTKMDDVAWAEKRFTNTVTQLASGPLKQCGYAPKNISSVAVSGTIGSHILMSTDPRICDWNKGPTLVHTIDRLVINNEHTVPQVLLAII